TTQHGLVAIHSSAKLERSEIEDACGMMRGFIPKFSERIFTAEVMKSPDRYPLGSILGTVELVDYVTASDSPWFCGQYGFVLRNPVAFKNPIPCRGALMFWEVPESALALMREEYRAVTQSKG